MVAKIKNFFLDNKAVLIVLFCFSLLIYGYFGVSTIVNCDGLDDLLLEGSTYNGKMYLSVGRWGWALICTIFNFYPAPVFCLILNSFLFSVAGVLLGKIYNLKNKLYICLSAMLLIAFPINLMAYSYFAWQYSIGLSFLIIIYGIYLLKKECSLRNVLLASSLICFAIGIYQVFICFAATLILYLIIITLMEEKNTQKIKKKIIFYLLVPIIAVGLYYIITKLTVLIFNVEMSSYQNASSMFSFDIATIFSNLGNSILHILCLIKIRFFPIWIQIILLLMIYVGIFINILKMKNNRATFILIFGFLLIFSANFLIIFKPTSTYHYLTYMGLSILYGGGIALLFKSLEKYNIKIKIKYFLTIITIICLFFIALNDNQMGVMAKKASDASFSYVNRMISKIESVKNISSVKKPYRIYMPNDYVNSDFYYENDAYDRIVGITSKFTFYGKKLVAAMNVLGFNSQNANLNSEEQEAIDKLLLTTRRYPEEGSIFIYKDIIVVNN